MTDSQRSVMNPLSRRSTQPITRLWQVRARDDGVDDNVTASRPLKDLGEFFAACACSGKAAATQGYDAVKLVRSP